ncbi:MAG: serine hydrolase [Saprospiraceae bacterium]|nr:serine hydrolase [Bacteroidia bacterium]NNE15295.1 serine hydrolase [Saprospiraceae bacterium]NNL93968.1 serine hydrolase [Saprospiraceae bacterium]
MNSFVRFLLILIFPSLAVAQDQLYFPPNDTDEWEKVSFEELGWCSEVYEELKIELEENGTRAFMILKDGKIVVEEYFNEFKQDSSWVWFSAAKSLTSFLVGLAQENGDLSINDPSHLYLGNGWSDLTPEQEANITVRHHLTMTTGLDYTVPNNMCTEPSCLQYLNPPGSHWFYHNAPYSIMRKLIETATGQNYNIYTFQNMHQTIGMDGFWINTDDLNLYFSTARSMARFGLLMLNNGDWNNQTIMTDKAYFNDMINTSQDLNPGYGYLWWLNGKENYKLPESDFVFNGPIVPNGFQDMYCAIGANAQILSVVPSQNIIMVRMGNDNSSSLVPFEVLHKTTSALVDMACNATSTIEVEKNDPIKVIPNPSSQNEIYISGLPNENIFYLLFDNNLRMVDKGMLSQDHYLSHQLSSGFYWLKLFSKEEKFKIKRIVIE